jgi:hypothetical protein
MVLDIIHHGDYPSLARGEVLMSVHLEKFFYGSPVVGPNLNQGWVETCDIDMLLGLWQAAERAPRHFLSAIGRKSFG